MPYSLDGSKAFFWRAFILMPFGIKRSFQTAINPTDSLPAKLTCCYYLCCCYCYLSLQTQLLYILSLVSSPASNPCCYLYMVADPAAVCTSLGK
jgi:hypothetical protein